MSPRKLKLQNHLRREARRKSVKDLGGWVEPADHKRSFGIVWARYFDLLGVPWRYLDNDNRYIEVPAMIADLYSIYITKIPTQFPLHRQFVHFESWCTSPVAEIQAFITMRRLLETV